MPLREISTTQANDPQQMSASQRASQSQREDDAASRKNVRAAVSRTSRLYRTHTTLNRQLAVHNEFAKQIEEKQAELVNPRTAELQNRLGDADKLLDGTQTTRELNRNTAVFCRLTEMGVEQARRLEKNLSKFTADQYVKKLKRKHMDEGVDEDDDEQAAGEYQEARQSFDWEALGSASFGMFRTAPTVDFMLGPYARPAPPPRRPCHALTSARASRQDAAQGQGAQGGAAPEAGGGRRAIPGRHRGGYGDGERGAHGADAGHDQGVARGRAPQPPARLQHAALLALRTKALPVS